MPKMTDDEIRVAVEQRFSSALIEHENLAKQRETALNFYYGRPLGNEIDGRSQVVSKDLMDTVDWTLPSLLRVFTTKQAVQFDPESEGDEDAAKQETEYCAHVFWKQNKGFRILYNWIKSGLMEKVAYVVYWWEEEEKVKTEEYTGLTQDQVTLVIQDLEAEGKAEVEVDSANVYPTAPGVPQMFDVKLKVKTKCGRLRIESVPGDEVYVSEDCRGSVKDAKFAGRLRRVSRSELMSMGFSRKEVDGVSDFSRRSARNTTETASNAFQTARLEDDGVDWATREFVVLDCWVDLDADGDGYAEKRHLIIHGDGILENEEADEVQMCSWTPYPMPNQHIGVDLFDKTEDVQRIQTALNRSLLDNSYFGNNQRLIYDKNTINVGMLQVNRPGAHIANDGPPGQSVMPVPVADIATRLLPVIQYTDEVRRKRTGVGWDSGVDADALGRSTKGAFLEASGRANQQIEAVARVFAETGYADLFVSIHSQLRKHQDWKAQHKLNKQWVDVNPSEWGERSTMSVSVGLGTAGKEEIRANLQAMATAQQQAAAVTGLIQPKNVYNLFRAIQTQLGFEHEDFVTSPDSPEFKQASQSASQPPPDPQSQAFIAGKQLDNQTRMQELASENRNKALDRANTAAIAVLNAEAGLLEHGFKTDIGAPGVGAEAAAGARPPGDAGAGAAAQPPPA